MFQKRATAAAAGNHAGVRLKNKPAGIGVKIGQEMRTPSTGTYEQDPRIRQQSYNFDELSKERRAAARPENPLSMSSPHGNQSSKDDSSSMQAQGSRQGPSKINAEQ